LYALGAPIRLSFAESLTADEFEPVVNALLSQEDSFAAGELAAYWAEHDLPAATGWFRKMLPEEQESVARPLMEVWFHADAAGALQWLEDVPPNWRPSLLKRVESALVSTAGLVEPERVLALVTPLGKYDVSTSSASVRGGDSLTATQTTGITALFAALTRQSPERAAARATALPPGGVRTEAMIAVARAWAASDPNGARHWVEGISDPALAAKVIPVYALGLRDSRTAAEWLGSLPLTEQNQAAMKEVMERWGASDPEGAIQWIDSLPAESSAVDYLGPILSRVAGHEPEKALQMIHARLERKLPLGEVWRVHPGYELLRRKGPDETLRAAESLLRHGTSDAMRVYQNIAMSVAERLPEQAAGWARTQPEGEPRRLAFAAVGRKWAQVDAKAALAWVRTLPLNEDTRSARAAVAEGSFGSQPAEVIQMLEVGELDPEEKQHLLSAAWYWLREEPGEADVWLQRTRSLSAAEKAQLKRIPR
jgi:hypothetical protein